MKPEAENLADLADLSSVLEVIDYDEAHSLSYTVGYSEKKRFRSLCDIPENLVRWINADGQLTEQMVESLGAAFQIHPLVLKNILHREQRAKIEVYGDFLYIVAKMMYFSGEELIVEHMNFILGKNFVISLGETKGDVFGAVRERLHSAGSHVRSAGADHLCCLLLDAIVEGYFDVLEVLSDRIDDLEEQVMVTTSQEHLLAIRQIKKSLLMVSKYAWPLRDVISLLGKDSIQLIRPATEPYFRDVYGHIIQAIDSTDNLRELLSGLTDLHISNTSYRLNEIMKVLTIISTIFIPLTFIAGVYGMNFKYMPELPQRWGYPAVWLVMVLISGGMVYFFKKRKWF